MYMAEHVGDGLDRSRRALLFDVSMNVSYIVRKFGWPTATTRSCASFAVVRK